MQVNTLILGAGAAGLMCAAHAGPDVLVIDHAKAPGEKIRISGGGRCNFTNMNVDPGAYLSQNVHFCKSALSRYTQWDFLDLVQRHKIAWHEKTLGQLFCDDKATQITQMLLAEASAAQLWLQTSILAITHDGARFCAQLERGGKRVTVQARNLVLATGGKSIPKMGATDLSLRLAQQFGLGLVPTRPGLVPLTFGDHFAPISGVAVPATVRAGGASFTEALLFTHRGLSGPAILQASSYWHEGQGIEVDFDPKGALMPDLRAQRSRAGRVQLATALATHIPARVLAHLGLDLTDRLADQSDAALQDLTDRLRAWPLTPAGSEGYRTAEVMVGGVSTDHLSSKTMESRVPGLFVIGEAVDVTGWLGGYNFQWAWSSGWAAGQAIAERR